MLNSLKPNQIVKARQSLCGQMSDDFTVGEVVLKICSFKNTDFSYIAE
jgi:hypothetical protein